MGRAEGSYAEFGIIESFDPQHEYSKYEPEKYGCSSIDDDRLNDWWEELTKLKTYNMSLEYPQTALSRWGVTLIPPSSLPGFLEIVVNDKDFNSYAALPELADKIRTAIKENKYMIHFGV